MGINLEVKDLNEEQLLEIITRGMVRRAHEAARTRNNKRVPDGMKADRGPRIINGFPWLPCSQLKVGRFTSTDIQGAFHILRAVLYNAILNKVQIPIPGGQMRVKMQRSMRPEHKDLDVKFPKVKFYPEDRIKNELITENDVEKALSKAHAHINVLKANLRREVIEELAKEVAQYAFAPSAFDLEDEKQAEAEKKAAKAAAKAAEKDAAEKAAAVEKKKDPPTTEKANPEKESTAEAPATPAGKKKTKTPPKPEPTPEPEGDAEEIGTFGDDIDAEDGDTAGAETAPAGDDDFDDFDLDGDESDGTDALSDDTETETNDEDADEDADADTADKNGTDADAGDGEDDEFDGDDNDDFGDDNDDEDDFSDFDDEDL